jgi:predicted glycoside hydrolase/deacetylase ChbG (UPF0249 family)
LKQLIVNADDFGFSPGVTQGIAECLIANIVSTTSVMACDADGLRQAAAWSSPLSHRIGIHLQLTNGAPCADADQVRSLLQEKGRFPDSACDLRDLKHEEILLEWHQQMERARHHGFTPTHVDTHHNVHRLPAVFEAYCEIARFYHLPARTNGSAMTFKLRRAGIRCADFCQTNWYKDDIGIGSFIRLVRSDFHRLGNHATVEMMCHPGHVDDGLWARSSYVEERELELGVLLHPDLRQQLRDEGIVLVDRSAETGAEHT